MELILIPALSFADRLRGTNAWMVWPMALIVGLAVSNDITGVILVTLAFVLGESTGWGETLGSCLAKRDMNPNDLDTFQKLHKKLGENVLLAVVVRGLIWASPAFLACYYTSGLNVAALLFVAILIPFVVSPYIIRALVKVNFNQFTQTQEWRKEIDRMLAIMEYLRGGLMGVILAAGQL